MTKKNFCNLEDLKENSEDLVLLTGNYKNFFGQLFYKNKLKDFEQILNTLKNSFKDKLYIEIQRHNEHQEKNFENYLLNISKSLQLPLIATQEIFYLSQDMIERTYFEEWQKTTFDYQTYNINYYREYVGKMEIFALNEEDDRKYGISIEEVFPDTIGNVAFTQDANSAANTCQIGFKFRYYRNIGYEIPSGENPYG